GWPGGGAARTPDTGSPTVVGDLVRVGVADDLPGGRKDRGIHRPDTAVGQAGVHDAAVQALQPPVVAAAGRERAALNAARVDHAAVPVLAELRVAARPEAGVGRVEVRVVPPVVLVGGAVAPGTVGGVARPAGPGGE